jgi:hypothetical protein
MNKIFVAGITTIWTTWCLFWAGFLPNRKAGLVIRGRLLAPRGDCTFKLLEMGKGITLKIGIDRNITNYLGPQCKWRHPKNTFQGKAKSVQRIPSELSSKGPRWIFQKLVDIVILSPAGYTGFTLTRAINKSSSRSWLVYNTASVSEKHLHCRLYSNLALIH